MKAWAVLAGVLGLVAMPARAQFWTTHAIDPSTGHQGLVYRDVARTPDGGYVMIDSECVVKIDAAGATAWDACFEGPEVLSLHAVTVTVDGTIVAIGRRNLIFEPSQLSILRLTPDGAFLSAGWLGAGNPTCVLPTPDGGVVIVCNEFVAKLDATGTVAWAHFYPDAGPLASGAVLPDGRIVVVGYHPDIHGRQGGVTSVIEADGTMSSRLAHVAPDGDHQLSSTVTAHANGDVTVISMATDPSWNVPEFWIERITPGTDIVWSERLSVRTGFGAIAATTLPDDSVVAIVGGDWVSAVPWGDGKQGLIAIEPDGRLRWMRVLAGIRTFGGIVMGTSGPVVAGAFDDLINSGPVAFVGELSPDGWPSGSCAAAYDLSEAVRPLAPCSELLPPIAPVVQPWTQVPLAYTRGPGAMVTTCASWDCPVLECLGVSIQPGSVAGDARLRLGHHGGSGAVVVEWDLDGDTVMESTGNPLAVTLGAGSHAVSARATDSCATPGAQSVTCSGTVELAASVPPVECDSIWLYRCGLVSELSTTAVAAVVVPSPTLTLDPYRDFVRADLLGLAEVVMAGDGAGVGPGNPGVIVFYELNSPDTLRVRREGDDVVLDGW